MRKDVVHYRKAIPPHNYKTKYVEPNPHVINDISRQGYIPSTDALVTAVSAIPAPYSVTTNTPATNFAGPSLDYYQNFKTTYDSGNVVGL